MSRFKLPNYCRRYKDRQGRERIYFRRAGQPQIALRGPLFSEAFWFDYQKAVTGQKPIAEAAASPSKRGTFNDLIARYYASPAYTTLAASTRYTYRRQIEPFRAEYGGAPVTALKTVHIDAILGKMAEVSSSQASLFRKRLATLMRLAVKWEFVTVNPMLNAERVRHKSKGYETWAEADIDAFRAHWLTGTAQRLAFEIMLYTGLRRSDAVRLCRSHVKGDFIVISTVKSQESVTLNIPVHPDFRAVLDGITHNHDHLIITQFGEPRSKNSLTNWIIEAATDAGLPPHRSPHGLRKAACRRLAEAGCSALEIMSITGHANIKEIETYCAAVNKKRLAETAIAKLKGAA